MASTPSSAFSSRRARTGAPADNLPLDWIIAISSCVNVFGLFLDGWAHNHGFVDDSFFTPWHAVLYGAILFAGFALILAHFRNVSRGYHWRRALPAGYGLSLFGFFIFILGGVGDMVWHETFGFEEDLEALLSPSHLFLALAGLLIITGPIRALWPRQTDHNWRELLPAILTFTCITSIFTFFTTFAAVTSELIALAGPRPESHTLVDIYGIVALVVQPGLLLAVVLFMKRRWQLPFGAITLLFVVNSLLNTWMHIKYSEDFILVSGAAAAGLLADYLFSGAKPATIARLRLASFLVPFVYSLAALFIAHILGSTVWADTGLWWEIHMWLGVPVLAGAAGYGISMLFRPPAFPDDSPPPP